MTYAIVYDSKTGNTEKLAQVIAEMLPKDDCVAFGHVDEIDSAALDSADRVYVGFCTNKGTCSQAVTDVLERLRGKEVFAFGTAGFGADETYFAGVAARALADLPGSADVVGTFMCQGRMPQSVRARYVHMAEENPAQAARIQQMIDNFDIAADHPNEDDFARLREAVANAQPA